MDKRVIVFLVLSLAIILGFDLLMRQMGWLPEPPPAQDGSAQAPASSEQDPAPAVPAGIDGVSTPNIANQSNSKSGTPASSIPLPSSEQTVTVETDLVRVEFSNHGGVIRSWELKRYHTSPPDEKPVDRKSTRLNSSHPRLSRMPSSA